MSNQILSNDTQYELNRLLLQELDLLRSCIIDYAPMYADKHYQNALAIGRVINTANEQNDNTGVNEK